MNLLHLLKCSINKKYEKHQQQQQQQKYQVVDKVIRTLKGLEEQSFQKR